MPKWPAEHPLLKEKGIIGHVQRRHSNYFLLDNHWIVASTLKGEVKTLVVYDSSYNDCSDDTKCILVHLMGCKYIKINMGYIEHQMGGMDCGVFAIVATSLAFGHHGPYHFHQGRMAEHLVSCLEMLEMLFFFFSILLFYSLCINSCIFLCNIVTFCILILLKIIKLKTHQVCPKSLHGGIHWKGY